MMLRMIMNGGFNDIGWLALGFARKYDGRKGGAVFIV